MNNESFFTNLNLVFTDLFLLLNQEQIINLNQELQTQMQTDLIVNQLQNEIDISNITNEATVEINEIQNNNRNRINFNSIIHSNVFRNKIKIL